MDGLAFFIIIGIIILIGKPITLLLINLIINKSSKNPKIKERPTFLKEVDKVIDYTILSTKNLQKELEIMSPLFFYEELFFMSFIEDVKLASDEKTKNMREIVLSAILDTLEKTKNVDYIKNKEYIGKVFADRLLTYTQFLENDDYYMSKDFYKNVLKYKAELMASIIKDNTLSNYNAFPKSPLEYSPTKLKDLSVALQLYNALKYSNELAQALFLS